MIRRARVAAVAERSWVVVGSGAVAAALSALSLSRIASLQTGSVDVTIIGHTLWRLAHGLSDVTSTTGWSQLAQHPSPSLLLFLPIFRIEGSLGIAALVGTQMVSVAAVGIALWRIAVDRGLGRGARLTIWLSTILNPVFWVVAWHGEFHMTTLALGPLAWVIAGSRSNRHKFGYAALVLFAAGARPELAISVGIAGALISREGFKRGRVALIGSLVMLGIESVMVVTNPGVGFSLQAHLGYSEGASTGIVGALLSNPGALMRSLLSPVMWISLLYWISVYGLIPTLRGRKWLLMAIPMVAIPVIGSWPWADLWLAHYWHPLFLAAGVSAVYGLRQSSLMEKRVFCVAMGVVLLVSWVGIGGGGDESVAPKADRELLQLLKARPDLAVSAPQNVAPVLIGRTNLWLYPRPFRPNEAEWGPFRETSEQPDVVLEPLSDPLSVKDTRGYLLVAECGGTRVWEREAGTVPADVLGCGS